MNNIAHKFLLAGDKFIPALHPRQPGFDRLLNILKELKKFRETGNLKHIYKNELDKACFVHDAVYSDRKDLAKKTISDKILKDRAYEIAINCKYDGY